MAASPENLRRNLAELVGPSNLNLDAQNTKEQEVKLAATLRWLQENPGWLLILDNVDDENTANEVEGLFPNLRGGEVLITSRIGRWSPVVEVLELDFLNTVDSVEFLLERTASGRSKNETDSADAKELAIELDGLALALEHASAYITQQRISLKEYLKHWRSHLQDVQNWHDPRVTKYPNSIAVTWQTTIEKLGAPECALLTQL